MNLSCLKRDIEPIEPITLVEPGIDHAEPYPDEGDPTPVGLAQQGAIEPLAWHRVPDERSHDRCEAFCQKIHC
jgi:hypothetical protein